MVRCNLICISYATVRFEILIFQSGGGGLSSDIDFQTTPVCPPQPAAKGTNEMEANSLPKEPSELVPLDLETLRGEVCLFLYECGRVCDEQEPIRQRMCFDAACDLIKLLRVRLRYGEIWQLEIAPENRRCVEDVANWVEECWKSTFRDEAQAVEAQQVRSLSEAVTDNVLFVASHYAIDAFARPDTGVQSPATKLRAWHEFSESPPEDFHPIPLRGTKRNLARWILPASRDSRPDRALDRKLTNSSELWGRKSVQTAWEVFFRDPNRFAEANRNRLVAEGTAE